MVATTYPEALRRLLRHEGGYTNHPADPGGPTNWGITIYDARRYLNPGLSARAPWSRADLDFMRSMTLDQAAAIYKPKYWDALRCDELEPGVDYATFDYGVNSGVGRSGRVLRRIVSLPDSISAVNEDVIYRANERQADTMVRLICDERLRFLHGLKTWPTFGGGWGRRVAEVKSYGLSIATDLPMIGSPPVVPADQIMPAPGRGENPDKVERVRALQRKLVRPPGNYDGSIDGDLGPKTVRAFQRSRGLVVDGIVGRVTRPLLDRALAEIPLSV